MKYKQEQWVIYRGKPYFIDYYTSYYNKYAIINGTNREREIVTEDKIEDIYPVEAIPKFNKGQTVITLTGQITQITQVDKGDTYKPYYGRKCDWFTPFEITKINY